METEMPEEQSEMPEERSEEQPEEQYKPCDCGYAVLTGHGIFDTLAEAIEAKDAKWARTTARIAKDVIGNVERKCQLSLEHSKANIEACEEAIGSGRWSRARDLAKDAKYRFFDHLYYCSKESEGL
jgi:hypothetical protein